MTALLLLSLSLGAPVPKETRKPPELTPGNYRIAWNSYPYSAELSNTGEFAEIADGAEQWWAGEWNWDATTRTLNVAEKTGNGDWYYRWKVVLDSDLKGTTDGGVRVKFTPGK